MAVLAPFKGLTYNFDRLGDLSKIVAPPYDVISEEEQENFYKTNPYNVIRLDLGKKKKGDTDWDNRYTRAADELKRWETDEVLIRSDTPSMFLTSIDYDPHDGMGSRTRWGLIALVRIEDYEAGVILPHEKTFSAHRDDRLKLMRACHTQLSQVFGLFDDPEDNVFGRLKSVITTTSPNVSFDLDDGTSHKMWDIKDASLFKEVTEKMTDKKIIIADGHHRYETSRNYRNLMRVRYGTSPENKSYEFLIMYLANMSDPGLIVLPSHRMIKKYKDLQSERIIDNMTKWFDIVEIEASNGNRQAQIPDIRERLEKKGKNTSSVVYYYHGSKKIYLLGLKPEKRDDMGGDLHPALKNLDVLVLSRLVFRKCLGFKDEDLDNDEIFHYNSNMEDALSRVDSGEYIMTFLLNHTKVSHVKEVAFNGLIMPRKSTYFYPKVITGLVFNKIDPNEIIQIP